MSKIKILRTVDVNDPGDERAFSAIREGERAHWQASYEFDKADKGLKKAIGHIDKALSAIGSPQDSERKPWVVKLKKQKSLAKKDLTSLLKIKRRIENISFDI